MSLLEINTITTGYVRRIKDLHEIIPLDIINLLTLMIESSFFHYYLPFQLNIVHCIINEYNCNQISWLFNEDNLLEKEWIITQFIPQIINKKIIKQQWSFTAIAHAFIRYNTQYCYQSFTDSLNIYSDYFNCNRDGFGNNILLSLDNYRNTKSIFNALYDYFKCIKIITRKYCNKWLNPFKYHKCTTLKYQHDIIPKQIKMITINHIYFCFVSISISEKHWIYKNFTVWNQAISEHEIITLLLNELIYRTMSFFGRAQPKYYRNKTTLKNKETLSTIVHSLIQLIHEYDHEIPTNRLMSFGEYMDLGYHLLNIDRNCDCDKFGSISSHSG